MNVGMIAEMLKLSPEKTTALKKAWDFASTAAAGLVTMNLLKGGVLIPGKNPAATASAAGDAVSLTTAAVIYVPCCGVPATISVQVDIAGTVNSATMSIVREA